MRSLIKLSSKSYGQSAIIRVRSVAFMLRVIIQAEFLQLYLGNVCMLNLGRRVPARTNQHRQEERPDPRMKRPNHLRMNSPFEPNVSRAELPKPIEVGCTSWENVTNRVISPGVSQFDTEQASF